MEYKVLTLLHTLMNKNIIIVVKKLIESITFTNCFQNSDILNENHNNMVTVDLQ